MNLELFFKTLPELRRVLTKYAEFKPTRVNLPNKRGLNKKLYREAVDEILKHESNLPPVVHYSLQHEFEQDLKTSTKHGHQKFNKPTNKTYDKFIDFLQVFGPRIKESGGEIMVVSGHKEIFTYAAGGEKKMFDSTQCLEQLSEDLKNLDYLRNSSGFVNPQDLLNIPDLKSMFNKDAQYIPHDLQINLEPEKVPDFGVVFNPYFSGSELKIEEDKLRRKLATGIVKSVWLQFGTDFEKLEKGVETLRRIQEEIRATGKVDKKIDHQESKVIHSYDSIHHRGMQWPYTKQHDEKILDESKKRWTPVKSDEPINKKLDEPIKKPNKSDVAIHGTIFIPTPEFLKRFQKNPWKGVHCSEEYLESEENAVAFTKSLLKKYEQLNVEPLIESAIRTETDENCYWKIFDKDEFDQKNIAEEKLSKLKEWLNKEEKKKVINSTKNKTLYSADSDKLKKYEEMAEDYQRGRPWY